MFITDNFYSLRTRQLAKERGQVDRQLLHCRKCGYRKERIASSHRIDDIGLQRWTQTSIWFVRNPDRLHGSASQPCILRVEAGLQPCEFLLEVDVAPRNREHHLLLIQRESVRPLILPVDDVKAVIVAVCLAV